MIDGVAGARTATPLTYAPRLRRLFSDLAASLRTNRRLILRLAIHDLRSRYAATVLGAVWAIVNPAVMILVYWLVAAYGLRIQSGGGPPYFFVLFCGFLPWIAFSEAITTGAAAIPNQAYLVRKATFPLEILPIVKVVSSLIVHLFLVALLIVILVASGMPPTLRFLQVLYFTAAMVALAIGIGWLTSALNVFHRDVEQVLGVIITIWFWSTPIIWPVTNLSPDALRIASLNPFFYIVEGYRNALLYDRPLLALWPLDLYFWTVAAAVLSIGAIVFRRLQPHFADVC
jgi:ABC-type polysaccharide/polyol phosphate export permease